MMEKDLEDLLKKVMEHQNEIEEAEVLLREQKDKHEAQKENLLEQFNYEKTDMQRLVDKERTSMEKAMQNLVNEIVRLKGERNEIRKNNRLEKKKLMSAFEDERVENSSQNELIKTEMQGKLEKKFQDDLEKAMKDMGKREAELNEELVKLKTERNDLVAKVSELEDKLGSDFSASEENEKSWASREKESREEIKNEFEEKMKVEKKRFQETLNSLRQEIERLQRERGQIMREISTKKDDQPKQVGLKSSMPY